MKVKEIMSAKPACCTPNDSAQSVAKMMWNLNVGSLPVVMDKQSHLLVGMITDRDLCCRVLAKGMDAKSTVIQEFISYEPVSCRDGENLDHCERLMQEHQVRRIPVVDGESRVIGIISQADLALREKRPERVQMTVAEVSKSSPSSVLAA